MSFVQGLDRYFAVLSNDQKARYLIAKEKSAKEKSLLDRKIEIADDILRSCHFCERRCGVDRQAKEVGYCGINAISCYASEFLHYGEEPELVPSHTIFFVGCTFACVYCQNWDIANRFVTGTPLLPKRMAEIITMRNYQGAKNVNFVGGEPTPHLHSILRIMNACNVNTPMVWNSNMYCSGDTMDLLRGVIDVYLADFRYGNDGCAEKYSNLKDYWSITTRNFMSAWQDAEVILRHLVLPNHLECCTKPIVQWVADHMPNIRFNLMFQYNPHYKANQYPELNRCLRYDERMRALEIVRDAGLKNLV
ncbi:MAG TPA: radical SAM protein [Methanocellales archaeon]|nr:radical SAM protein [Methanocellales archaeon]